LSGNRRIGVLGGSFDPVHIGHLIAAEEAARQLGLDRVWLTPTKDQWRKPDRQLAPTEHRLFMLRLAASGNPAIGVSEVDIRREGPSYTKDTLADLHAELGDNVDLHFILGFDALADLPHWIEPQRIADLATLVTVVRPGYEIPWANLEAIVPSIRDRVLTMTMPEVGISSTEIRRRLAAGESVRYWVPDAVIAYIGEHRLYGVR